jgi:hypothetical protein
MKDIKKSLIMIFAVLFVFTFTKVVFAAQSGQYKIKVAVVEEALGIQVLADTVDLGYVVKGSSVITTDNSTGRTIIKNIGSVNITLKLQLTGCTTSWTPGTTLTNNGVDQYVLATVFEQWDGTHDWSHYDDEDVITSSEKTCTAASSDHIFAPSTSQGGSDDYDGYNIPPGGEVSNFYFFKAPSSLTTEYGRQETITVTVTAIQQQ